MTIRLLSPTEGGVGAAHTQLVADKLSDYLPGNPRVIVQDMAGAGGLIFTNYLWNYDGSRGDTIGYFHSGTMMNQVLGVEGVHYDARDFLYLGGVERGPYSIPVLDDSPFETWEDMFNDSPKTMLAGASGAAGTPTIVMSFVQWLGADVDVIVGYGGAGPRRLGVESGEIDTSYLALGHTVEMMNRDAMRALIRTGPPHPLYGDAPTLREVTEMVADIDDPIVSAMLTLSMNPLEVGASFVAPPGTSPEVAEAFARALEAIHQDAEFRDLAGRAELEYEPWFSAEELRGIQLSVLDVDPQFVEQFREEVLGGAEFGSD